MTQPKQLVKYCTAKVRRAAIGDCGGKLRLVSDRGYLCPNKEMHLNPMLTGYCDSGWHEGNKINKPTCRFWVTCPCDCHTQLSRIADLTGTERVLIDNSTWTSGNQFVQVSLTESVQAAALVKPNAILIPSALPELMPSTVQREFAPTGTGRAGRGELEDRVQRGVQRWVTRLNAGEDPPSCTPPYLSLEIQQHDNLEKAPSTGAIDAVFKRWLEIGYALIGSKPTRFVAFTPAGIRDGLEVMKARAKRK